MFTEFFYYSYCRNPTGQEVFVPAATLIAVKLFKSWMHNILCNRRDKYVNC